MGGAILHGVLDAAFSSKASDFIKRRPVSRFIACTKTAPSADRLRASIPTEQQPHIQVMSSQAVPVQVMNHADIVVLGFKPFMAEDVLSAEGVREALAGKLVISLLAGQTPQNLARIIREGSTDLNGVNSTNPVIVKAIPNMGAQFRQSVTIIETPDEPIPEHMTEVVEWMFKQVGEIKYLPQSQMDLGSVLVGAALAAMTVPIEGILDGCVAEGLKRNDAMEMLLGGLRGLSAALESGIHPAVLRESISSPRGCTIQALLTLEKAGSRADYAEAIINGTQHLKKADK
ncbi:Pyrroline-5-carboxylate reductase [Penicillium subrubescens]|uniref:Pyrroline-5-carboxylate reductase n=2 Tax=Penicillium subrubescens TaxID=1316194 RepID=A0A1Q5UP55_9EURO|nr:Pyrroline-5-carboxylate reductase [Penicillium subrubescens]